MPESLPQKPPKSLILALVLVLLFVFLTGLVSSGLPGMGNFVSEVTQPIALIIAYTIRIVYALVFYPSYFTDKPVIVSKLFVWLRCVWGALESQLDHEKERGFLHRFCGIGRSAALAHGSWHDACRCLNRLSCSVKFLIGR